MKKILGWSAAAVLVALALASLPAPRAAWAAAVDLVVAAIGVTLPTDNGKQHGLMVAASDGTSARHLSVGSAAQQSGTSTSSTGTMVVQAADKTVNSTPAVSTQATASIASGGAGVRHIGTSCNGSISTVAAQTNITLALRDGATGAGTVLWSGTAVCPISTLCAVSSPPLNALGSAATAMTCEWSGAPVTNNFAVANLSYKNAQ